MIFFLQILSERIFFFFLTSWQLARWEGGEVNVPPYYNKLKVSLYAHNFIPSLDGVSVFSWIKKKLFQSGILKFFLLVSTFITKIILFYCKF